MENNLKFSVSMNVYHGDDPVWFREAVDSVLNQTVRPEEIVLVVDGPVPEALEEIIAGCEKTEPFVVVRLPENSGHGNARRIGLEKCSHDLVAIMDADDLCLPDRFEKQLAVFRDQPDVSAVGGQIAEFLDTVDNVIGIRQVPLTDEEIRQYIKTRCPLNQVTVMLKKADVQAVGGFLDWFCNEDYYLWIRMYLAKMRFANVPDILVNVRVGADMYKRRGGFAYFKSEYRLQKYMRKHRVIGFGTYVMNVAKRLILQLLMPNWMRAIVYRKLARQ